MPQVETFKRRTLLVVSCSYHLPAYMEGRHGYQSYVELQGHGEVSPHIALEVILMVSESAQILGIVAYCLPKFFGVFDGF